MITNLLNQEQFVDLLQAIYLNENFCFTENGLTIKSIYKDGVLTIEGSYKQPNMVEKELEDFKNYTESIDDNLFVEVCEYLGELELQKIQGCIASRDVEAIRAGVFKFKNTTKEVIHNKINYLTKLFNL